MTLERPRADLQARAQTFAEAAEENLDAVYGYLVYLVRNRDTAEDLAGATFEKALRSWTKFDPRRGTARTWLLGIARTTALDWFRSESRRKRREESAAVAERVDVEFVEGLSPELERALAELSPADREIVVLRVVLELEPEATSRILGISTSAVSTRLSRALKRLEERVNQDDLR